MLDWADYFLVQPFGEERADIRNAQLCKAVVDFHYSLGGKANPHKFEEYILFKGLPQQQKIEEQVVVDDKEKPRKGAKISQELLTQFFLVSAVKGKR